MNLLEHYIDTVYSVNDVTNEISEHLTESIKEPFVEVDMDINCWGCEERVTQIFTLSQWYKIQQDGYYMA